jgi:hypothetical protein
MCVYACVGGGGCVMDSEKFINPTRKILQGYCCSGEVSEKCNKPSRKIIPVDIVAKKKGVGWGRDWNYEEG